MRPTFFMSKTEKNKGTTIMAFKKGESGNPSGRPEGSKNKNAMRPIFWWNWFQDEVEKLPEEQRVPQIKWALELMMPKVPALPSSPGDSVHNAANAFDQLNGIAPLDTPVESQQNALGLNGAD